MLTVVEAKDCEEPEDAPVTKRVPLFRTKPVVGNKFAAMEPEPKFNCNVPAFNVVVPA